MNENWSLLGHEWAVQLLRQHVAQNNARHAYLFLGPQGIGKRTLALRFAEALNCESPLAPGVSCGVCKNCRQIEAMRHPDLSVVQASEAGGVLRVDQIRDLRHMLTLSPYQAKYRVALLLRFQEANASAANALLKTLEEAPSQVVLLLTAENAEQLLPTIVSRCEVLRLRPLPLAEIETALRERGASEVDAALLAHLSGGSPGRAFRLLEDRSELDFRAETLDALQPLLSASIAERFRYAERLSKEKEALRRTLLLWASYWRDVMLAAAGDADAIVNIDRREEILAWGKRFSLPEARARVDAVTESISRLDKNINPRLLLETLLLDLPKGQAA